MAQSFRLRRGTAAQWTAANPVLAQGEPGYETDTGNFKVGDGSTSWTSLPLTNTASLGGDFVARASRTAHAPALGLFFPEAEGAVGNGTTDDRAALVATITAAAGATVVLKSGTTYGISSAIIPAVDNVTITGSPGSVIKPIASTVRVLDLNNRTGLRFDGVTFDLGGMVTSAGVRAGTGSTNHTFTRCTFRSTGAALGPSVHALDLTNGATDVTVRDSLFSGLLDNIRVQAGVVRPLIADNRFTGWGNRAIYVLSTATDGSTDLTIRGNRIHSHNTAGDPRQPIAIQWAGAYHIGVTIAGNTVVGNGAPHHDGLGASLGGTADAISLHGCRGFKVIGNTVRASGEVGITIGNGCANGVVSGNDIDTCNSVGVACEGTASPVYDVNVTGNTFRNCGIESGQTPARTGVRNAVWVVACSNVNVDANTCVDDQGTPTMLGVLYARDNPGQVTVGNNPRRGVTNLIDPASTNNTSGIRVQVPSRRVSKTADTTRNNTAARVADPHLTIPSVQVGTYRLRAFLAYQATSTADLAVSWTRPGGTVMQWTANSPVTATTSVNTLISRLALNHASAISLGGVTSNDTVAMFEGVVTIAVAGAVTLDWAQGVAEVSDAIIRSGSWLELEQIA